MRPQLPLFCGLVLLAACADHRAGRVGPTTPQVANVSFRTRSLLPLDVQRSVDIVVADLDGDGLTDIAAADLAGRVVIRIGAADGTYTTREALPVAGEPLAIEAADLDGDGLLDLVVASATANVATVFHNVGGNTFQSTQVFDVQDLPTGMVVGDLNGDTAVDMVVTHLSRSDLLVFEGLGDGTFGQPISIALPRGTRTAGLTIGDADDDGRQDILICDTDNDRIVIRLSNDPSSGGTVAVVPVGSTPIALALGDLDDDGRTDIAVSNFGSERIDILSHTGDNEFVTIRSLQVSGRPARSVIADLDSDGFDDLAVCLLNKSAVSIFHGTATGVDAAEDQLPATGFPYRPLVADLTGDGRPDLGLVSSNIAAMNVLANSETGLLTGRTTASSAGRAQIVCAADFDGDGRDEIAVAGTDLGTLAILDSTDLPRGPSVQEVYSIDVGRTFSNLHATDIDDDGRPDLMLGVTGGVLVLANRSTAGELRFEPASGSMTDLQLVGSIAAGLAAVDVTGDGVKDLIATFFGDETVGVARGTGTAFGFEAPKSTPLPGRPFSLAVADFDSDGKRELAVSMSALSTIQFLEADGAGALTPTTMLEVGPNPTYISGSDFDGNGRADLAVSNANDNTVQMFIQQIGGGFARVDLQVGAVPTALAAADLDMDGFPDLTITTLNGMSFEVVLSDGQGGARSQQVFPGVYGATSAVFADVTGSPMPDLVIGSGEIDRVTVYQNESFLIDAQ